MEKHSHFFIAAIILLTALGFSWWYVSREPTARDRGAKGAALEVGPLKVENKSLKQEIDQLQAALLRERGVSLMAPEGGNLPNCGIEKQDLELIVNRDSWRRERQLGFSIEIPDTATLTSRDVDGHDYGRSLYTLNQESVPYDVQISVWKLWEIPFAIDRLYSPDVHYELYSDTWWMPTSTANLVLSDFVRCDPTESGMTFNQLYPIYFHSGGDAGARWYEYSVLLRDVVTSNNINFEPLAVTFSFSWDTNRYDARDFLPLLETIVQTIQAEPASRG